MKKIIAIITAAIAIALLMSCEPAVMEPNPEVYPCGCPMGGYEPGTTPSRIP
ncbi:MAG TPA: hypothetical protein PLW14_03130 [Chlorobiota bacterium]|nr:hypothetical protein [Chlorobiota bacterium]